jgi:hypothetical protein
VVGASVAGTSHDETGRPCEDDCYGAAEVAADGSPLLILAVADGAGSAPRGKQGAEAAVVALAGAAAEAVGVAGAPLDASLALSLLRAARQSVASLCALEPEDRPLRDFACTLLALVATPRGALAMQIGDGAIVLDCGEGLHVAIEPMSGEYANMTRFITDVDAEARLQARSYTAPPLRAAALSDGLQRLALDLALGAPHPPFFDPLFRTLTQAPAGSQDALTAALAAFLGSAAVNERTDDDKTLVLAAWED